MQGAYAKGAALLMRAHEQSAPNVYGSSYFDFGSLVLSLSRALVALGQVSLERVLLIGLVSWWCPSQPVVSPRRCLLSRLGVAVRGHLSGAGRTPLQPGVSGAGEVVSRVTVWSQ